MLKVAIMEDEPILLKGLLYRVDWLSNDCTVVGAAEDGAEGLNLIKQTKPDIIITDIRMPFKDGLAMLKEAKADHSFEAIILSGFGEFDYAKQAITIGVHDYLLKPVDMHELEATLQKLVQKLQAQKSNDHLTKQTKVYSHLLDLGRGSHSTYVAEIMDFIKKHYHEKVTLKAASNEIGLSTVSLNDKLKEKTGYSFNELVTRYRLTKAISLLQDEKLLIYEVAEKTGFSDYKYFSQVFKKYTGMSPKQFCGK
ncbi:response regulator [Shouchella clausii]